MSELIERKIKFSLIPPVLEQDFERTVLDVYCDSNWLDLHHVAECVEDYSIRSASYEETGDPFQYEDNPKLSEDFIASIHGMYFNELLSDVYQVLDFHRMFHAWNDLDECTYRMLISTKYSPWIEVW